MSHGAYKFTRKPTGDIKETYGVPVEKIQRGIVKARFEAFGCAGQGSKIKPVPLEVMARRYG